MKKYLAVGNVITNRLVFTDKRVIKDIMGGHGIYAHEGVAFGTDNSVFIGAVGKDFDELYGKWFDDNKMSRDGLIYRLDRCNYNEVVYAEDGQYVEYSIYGPEEEEKNLPLSDITIDDILPHLEGAYGMYSMFQFEPKAFSELKEKYGFKYMWEYTPKRLRNLGKDAVLDYIGLTDIYSFNKPESFELFGVDNEEAVISEIKNLGKPCYYRVGSKGAYMVTKEETAFIPVQHIVPKEQEIDPTGCGNSSTGAAMWAFTEGYDPLMTCIWGNVIAGFNVQQYGPMLDIGEEKRALAHQKAEELYKEYKK